MDNCVVPYSDGSDTDGEIILSNDCDDLLFSDQGFTISYSEGAMGTPERLDSIIPALGVAADAAAHYNQAIVKFPPGVTWADLINRKGPEWEGFKQLGSFKKDGSFNVWAGIKQAKVSPTAVANMALQGAALAVGQAYMTEINDKLQGLESGIEEIKHVLEADRESKLIGNYRMLKKYALCFEDYNASPEKRQAAFNEIESITTQANQLWVAQMKMFDLMNKELSSPKKMKQKDILEAIEKAHRLEMSSSVAFQLLAMASQTSMRYDDDYSEKRIAREKEMLAQYCNEYGKVHGAFYCGILDRIDGLKGLPVAVPATKKKDSPKSKNPLVNAGQNVNRLAGRLTAQTPWDAARSQLEDKKHSLIDAASVDDPVKAFAEKQEKSLETLDYLYNKANAVVVDHGSIRVIRTNSNPNTGSTVKAI